MIQKILKASAASVRMSVSSCRAIGKKNAGHVHSIFESGESVKLLKITRACVKCTIGIHMFAGTQKSNSLCCNKHDDTGCTVDVKKY